MPAKKKKEVVVEKTPQEKCLEKLDADMAASIDLPQAAYFGNTKQIALLLGGKAKVKVDAPDTITGQTPFALAAMNGHRKAVEALLEGGAELNKQGHGGQTALHLACANEHIELVEWLIEAKADIEVEDDAGNSPMNEAARNGHLKIVDILCEAGGNMEHANKAGCTPFLNSTLTNKGAAVEVLVRRKCQLDVTNKDGCSALHIATMCGYEKLLRQLLGSMVHLVGMVNNKGQKAMEMTTNKDLLAIFEKFTDRTKKSRA